MPTYTVRIDDIVDCLRASKSIREAFDQIEAATGRRLTPDALQKRLKRSGAGKASELLDLDPWWKRQRFRSAADRVLGTHVETFKKLAEYDGDIPVEWAEPETSAPPADRTYVEKPDSDYNFAPLDCGKEPERIFLIPDTHRPYHDKQAWAVTLRAAREFRPHTVMFTGDWVDAYSVSSHDRDPRRLHQLADEVKDANDGLDEVQGLKPERVIFIAGNHEDRITRYLLQHAPALLDITSIPQLLRLQERGWHYVPYKRHAKLGRLYGTHDAGYSGVNSIRSTANAFRHNVAFGHSHRLGISYYGTLVGERFFSANLGWLGDLDAADYAHESSKADWAHGFGTALMEKNGNVHMTVVPIVDRRACVLGKIVS